VVEVVELQSFYCCCQLSIRLVTISLLLLPVTQKREERRKRKHGWCVSLTSELLKRFIVS